LISAPAGFGKTTILSTWIARTTMPIAWFSLDEADNNLTRFWSYVVAALERVNPSIGAGAQTNLHAPQPVPIENILSVLLNDIALDSEPSMIQRSIIHSIFFLIIFPQTCICLWQRVQIHRFSLYPACAPGVSWSNYGLPICGLPRRRQPIF
jgi:hypothetical protein